MVAIFFIATIRELNQSKTIAPKKYKVEKKEKPAAGKTIIPKCPYCNLKNISL